MKYVAGLKSCINYTLKILLFKIEWNAFPKSCILFMFNPISRPPVLLQRSIFLSPAGQSQEQIAKVKLLLPEVWLGFGFRVDWAKMSEGGGLRVCSVALIWVRDQLASNQTFWGLHSLLTGTSCQETIFGTHVP